MKNNLTYIIFTCAIALFSSCNKETCAECHYDLTATEEVELGEKCGDDLAALESTGIAVGDTLYEVHCHEH
jgi:hypothetical protein